MITDYDRLLRLTLELEGILTLRVNRRDTIDATNASRLDEMIDSLLAELGNTRLPQPSEPSEPTEPSDNSDNSDPFDPSDSSDIAEAALLEEAADADTTSSIGEQPAAMSLNDRLAREKALDLTGAFSLNDRFRFCRELFRGSQQEMNEAIEALSQMSTAEEACEYIYEDLCLDPDNEDVKAFMEIITKHF